MSAEPQKIRVVACVIERDGQFLITKRLKHSHLGHLWEFPGGKIEPGETVEACAIRECKEEIDVDIQPLRLIQELHHDYPEVSVHLYFVLCEFSGGEPKALHCADWKWVRPEELATFEFPEADKKILEILTTSM
jgi:mutator mutT protein